MLLYIKTQFHVTVLTFAGFRHLNPNPIELFGIYMIGGEGGIYPYVKLDSHSFINNVIIKNS